MTPTTPLYPVKVQEAIKKGLINKDLMYFVIHPKGQIDIWSGSVLGDPQFSNPKSSVLLPKPEAAEISEEEMRKKVINCLSVPDWMKDDRYWELVIDSKSLIQFCLSFPSSNRQTEVSKEAFMKIFDWVRNEIIKDDILLPNTDEEMYEWYLQRKEK